MHSTNTTTEKKKPSKWAKYHFYTNWPKTYPGTGLCWDHQTGNCPTLRPCRQTQFRDSPLPGQARATHGAGLTSIHPEQSPPLNLSDMEQGFSIAPDNLNCCGGGSISILTALLTNHLFIDYFCFRDNATDDSTVPKMLTLSHCFQCRIWPFWCNLVPQ